jgi:hypothetical protein
MPIFSPTQPFIWSANTNGLAVRFSDPNRYEKAKGRQAAEDEQVAFIRMQMLIESGEVDVVEVDRGIFVGTSDAVRLDLDTRESFALPPAWPGGMRLQTDSVPQMPEFRALLGLVDSSVNVAWDWVMRGPILEVSGLEYLPTTEQFTALQAYRKWELEEPHDEFSNLSLLAALRESWQKGCRIHLETYEENTIISRAKELSLDAREEASSGDLILRPVVTGDFPELDVNMIEERLAQLQIGDERTVLRVGQTIVLLDPTKTAQARAVAANARVPRNQRDSFEKNPSGWLAEHVFPEIEIEFSPRVTGVGVWEGGYLGAAWEDGQDWFGKQPTSEKSDESDSPGEVGSPSQDGEENEPTDIDPTPQEPIVPLIIPNDEELGFGWRFSELSGENEKPFIPDFSRYARKPMAHQEEAVRWLLDNARRAQCRQCSSNDGKGFGAGALLADDMGLGKTFSTLIFLSEWLDFYRKTTLSSPPAVLVVAPLSLLENWKEEIEKSYQNDQDVFTRVLVAQGEGELHKIRRSPNSRDIAKPDEVVQYGLCFGDGTEKSLDYPGSCVLTTYQTLRKYRFSFAKADWSAAIFDEAQNIKNPNALQTISAKALKALFRITLTGTPVENHLGDFWCILDTAEPGPLGSFAEFKRNWILRMQKERSRMAEIGKELRDHVGSLMLRRNKEEVLEGLPKKKGGSKPIFIDMSEEQIEAYDAVVTAAQNTGDVEGPVNNKRQNRQLAALWQLRQVSLHPDLLGGGIIDSAKNSSSSRLELQRSGKLNWLLLCLDQIKDLGEKALIFCVQKKLQEALSFHLEKIYGLIVPIINGDTKSTSKRRPETTRLGLIKEFSKPTGFGICILSPIAAGAGLNIVEANHVIHLERHWNPAKEDQATDRVYRIGQSRPVTVYLPTAIHPEMDSFDLVLQNLLEKKRGLQSALGLVPPEAVSAPELINEVFTCRRDSLKSKDFLDLQNALKLSWKLFEALIATLYKADAERVILTPGGSDHGCDVVVLGLGEGRENLLIQCKKTGRSTLDSEVAVREIEGARPFYENALKVSFNRRCLHTTAKKFSRRTRHAAELCGVDLHGRSWLAEKLKRKKIHKSNILSTDLKREKIM